MALVYRPHLYRTFGFRTRMSVPDLPPAVSGPLQVFCD